MLVPWTVAVDLQFIEQGANWTIKKYLYNTREENMRECAASISVPIKRGKRSSPQHCPILDDPTEAGEDGTQKALL